MGDRDGSLPLLHDKVAWVAAEGLGELLEDFEVDRLDAAALQLADRGLTDLGPLGELLVIWGGVCIVTACLAFHAVVSYDWHEFCPNLHRRPPDKGV